MFDDLQDIDDFDYWQNLCEREEEQCLGKSAGLSIPAPIKAMRQYAEEHHAKLVELYHEAHSAFNESEKRPEFNRMIKRAIADREITGVLVHDFSRFSRDSAQAQIYTRKLREADVMLYSVTDPTADEESAAGIYLRHILLAKNEAFSCDIAFHTRKGMKENIARRDATTGWCYKNGGAAPWGFLAYKEQRGTDKRQQPVWKTFWKLDDTDVAGHPVSWWVHHMLIDLRLNQKASLDTICNYLNGQGIPAPRKQYWGSSSVRALLQPAALLQYAGIGVWNVHDKHGKVRPATEWVIVPEAHPPLISMKDAEALVALNEKNRASYSNYSRERQVSVRSRGSRFLLSGGLFICAQCGEHMTSFTNQGRDYYVCGAKRYRKGLGCGNMTQLRKSLIEHAVAEEIEIQFKLLTNPARLAKILNTLWIAQHGEQARRYTQLQSEFARIEKEEAAILATIKRGNLAIDFIVEEANKLSQRKAEVRAELAACAQQAPSKPMLTIQEIKQWQARFLEVMRQGTPDEQREFIRIFMRQIRFAPQQHAVLMEIRSLPSLLEGESLEQKKDTTSQLQADGVIPIGSGGRLRTNA